MPRVRRDRPGTRQSYHLTCANCRNRKVKCDSQQPECGVCIAYGDSCHYDRVPAMTQIRAMVARIQQLESELKQRSVREVPEDGGGGGSSNSDVEDRNEAQVAHLRVINGAQIPEIVAAADTVSSNPQESNWFASTSAVHEPSLGNQASVSTARRDEFLQEQIPLAEQQLDFWQDTAIQTCACLAHLPAYKVRQLLRIHFSWVLPAFMFFPRHLFLRDATNGGPNFSLLLLNVICLHTTRFTEDVLTTELLARAQLLLSQEIHKPPTVPLVQALLEFSAWSVGKGNFSQAFLYSGMAFRIVIDLGIFRRDTQPDRDINTRTVRQNLGWSSYLWDKAMSLYLGRAPILTEPPPYDPPLVNDIAESGLWQPYFIDDATKRNVPEMTSYSRSCFQNFCHLSVIINDILLTIYGASRHVDISAFVNSTSQRLEAWRRNSPPYLRIETRPDTCSPPYIISQNMLYHTTLVLLNRPFRGNVICKQACTVAAGEVEHLLLLLENTLGFSYVTYLMAYCAYTAATVALCDMKDGIAGAGKKVNTFLRALYSVCSSCPGIRKSIDIIIKNFDIVPEVQNISTPMNITPAEIIDFNPFPAFPFDFNTPNFQVSLPESNSLVFGDLDSYAHEWSTLTQEQLEDLIN